RVLYQVAVLVEFELPGTREYQAVVALEDEEAVAVYGRVEWISGLIQLSFAEGLPFGVDGDTGAIRGRTRRTVHRSRAVTVHHVTEHRLTGLESRCVQIGNVVADEVEPLGVGVQAGQTDVDGVEHVGLPDQKASVTSWRCTFVSVVVLVFT